jgi:hypothetical protein
MTQLGGHGLFIDWRTTNFTLADIAFRARGADLLKVEAEFSARAVAKGVRRVTAVTGPRAVEANPPSDHVSVVPCE